MTDDIVVVVESAQPDIVVELAEGSLPGPVDTTTADALEDHLEDDTPHPVYDDMPDLAVLFENGLV